MKEPKNPMITYRCAYHTLSPVHIGTGETLRPFEYLVLGDNFVVPDLESILTATPAAGNRFLTELTRRSPAQLAKTRLVELLDPAAAANPKIARYRIPVMTDDRKFSVATLLASNVGEALVRTAIKTPDDRAYIPGSSVKGALRTAWLYGQLAKSDTSHMCERALEIAAKANRSPERRVDERFTEAFFLGEAAKDEKFKGTFDVFRAVRVADSTPKPVDDVLTLAGARVLSVGVPARGLERDHINTSYKPYWIFCETIDERMTLPGRISIDNQMLTSPEAQQKFLWSEEQKALSIKALRDAANQFAARLCDWEIGYFSRAQDVAPILEFYEDLKSQVADPADNEFFLSIGYGSGWQKMTPGTLFQASASPQVFEDFRRTFNLARQHTAFEFPKSRKLVMLGDTMPYAPFGWVRVRFEQVQEPSR